MARRFPRNSHSSGTRLARIEDLIGRHRKAYLQATWDGRQGDAEFHDTRISDLLGLWQHIVRGVPLTATEETLCD